MAFGFLKDLFDRFSNKPVDWDELEESLIRADIGVPMTLEIIKALQERPNVSAKEIVSVVKEHIEQILPLANPRLRPLPDRPKVILMTGVNGTGKTTSTAKLAYLLKKERHSVMLAAADTFRAAAIEQLKIWGDRVGVEVVAVGYQHDPPALCCYAYNAPQTKTMLIFVLAPPRPPTLARH